MLNILLILIFIRPFISSLAFPYFNLTYSLIFLCFLGIWAAAKQDVFKTLRPIKYPFALFCLALLISTSLSKDIIVSLAGLYGYLSGLLILIIAASLNVTQQKKIIRLAVFASLIISLLAIYQYFYGFRHIEQYMVKEKIKDSFALDYISRKRIFFPFITPNILGGYLAMMLPLAFAYKDRFIFILPLAIALFLTKSIGALFSIIIVIGIYLCLSPKIKKRHIFTLGITLAIIAIIFFLRSMTNSEHARPGFSATMRLQYWKDTWQAIRSSPLYGLGTGNFNLNNSRFSHNSYLQLWAETGILGLYSFLWLLTSILKNALRLPQKETIYIVGAILVFLIHNLFDFAFFLPEITLIWWALLGCLLSDERINDKQIDSAGNIIPKTGKSNSYPAD